MKRAVVASFAVSLLLAGLVGCSSDGGSDGSSSVTNPTIDPNVPQSLGDSCTDPVGDLSPDIRPGTTGTLTQPAGVDLTRAEASIAEDTLTVEFTVAGMSRWRRSPPS